MMVEPGSPASAHRISVVRRFQRTWENESLAARLAQMILETGMSRDINSCLVQISSSLAMGSSGVGLSLNVHRPVNISIRMVPEPSATSIGFDPVSRQPQNI